MPIIENRFRVLLAAKERRDGRRYSYRTIAEITGIDPTTLTRFSQQRHRQYTSDTLATLCDFLGCEVGDLLVMVDDDPEKMTVAVA